MGATDGKSEDRTYRSCSYFAIIVALVNHVFIYRLDIHWIADAMFLVLCLIE